MSMLRWQFATIAILSASLFAQNTLTVRLPAYVKVGQDSATIDISLDHSPGPVAILWNGVERPLLSNYYGLQIAATKEDLAKPGIAEITVIDAKTRETLGFSYLLIGFDVPVGKVVGHPTRSRIYVTTRTPSTSGRQWDSRFPANSVTAVDPATGAVGPVYSAGAYVGDMAISESGALYVVVDGSNKIVRLNPDTLSAISEFSLGPISTSPYYGTSIATIPGREGSLVVNYRLSGSTSDSKLAIFDNGIKRPSEIATQTSFTASMLASPDGKYVFSGLEAFWNPLAAGTSTISRYTLAATGVPIQQPLSIKGGKPLAVENGLLYTSGGTVVDVESGDLVNNLGIETSALWDSVNKRFLASHAYFQAFDGSTGAPLGWIQCAQMTPILRFGNDGVVAAGDEALFIFHTPLAGPAPSTSAAGIIGAATSAGGAIAPGEILSLYGSNLGPASPAAAAIKLGSLMPVELANTQVWFDRTPASMLLSYSGQLNVIAPFQMEPGSSVKVQVWRYGLPSSQITMQVQSAQPGLFTRNGQGTGPVSVINQDGSVNTPSPPGSIVSLYGTGGGRSAKAKDRELATAADTVFGDVKVFIGGQEARVYYAGAAPSLPYGALQINAEVPAGLKSGTTVPVVVRINGYENRQGATLEIR